MVWNRKLRESFLTDLTVTVETLNYCTTKGERERDEPLAEIEMMKLFLSSKCASNIAL